MTSIGVRPAGAAIPCRTDCPLCGVENQFTVYDDPVYSGQWFHCASCGRVGDMIELAAAVWKVDASSAARRLLAEGRLTMEPFDLHRTLPNYEMQCVAYRRRLREFWEKSRLSNLVVESGSIQTIIRRIGLTPEVDIDRWRAGTGRVAGACTRREAEEALRIRPPGTPDQWLRRVEGPDDFPEVPQWDEMLVIPAWDMPGRISSFTFVGRGGPDDVRTRSIRVGGRRIGNDLGIVALPECMSGSDVILVDDPVDCVRLHDRFRRSHCGPFPVGARFRATPDNRLTASYAGLVGRQLTFWGMETTAELIRTARSAGGRVCAEDGRSDHSTRYLSRLDPAMWRNSAESRSKTWLEALDERLKRVEPSVGDTELAGLALNDRERLEMEARPDLAVVNDRWRVVTSRFGRMARLGSYTFTETVEGWSRNGKPFSNVQLRINSVLETTSRHYYRGVIRYGDREIPFTVPTSELRPAWLRKYCADHGVRLFLPSKTGADLATIAIAMHTPKNERGFDRCGWDGEANGFVFADFVLRKDGIEPHGVVPTFEKGKVPRGQKAEARRIAAVCQPGPLGEGDWHALTAHNRSNPLFWAVTSAVLANVLAPAFHLEPTGVAIHGPSADLAIRMSKWLGCPFLQIASPEASRWGTALLDFYNRADVHNWPLAVEGRTGGPHVMFRNLVEHEGRHNCLMTCDLDEARVLSLSGKWSTITADAETDPDLPTPACRVVASFLQWLLARGLTLSGNRSFQARTLDTIIEWARESGRDVSVMEVAGRLMEPVPAAADRPMKVASAFGGLLGDIHREFPVFAANPQTPQQIRVCRSGGSVWVSKVRLYGMLAKRGMPAINDAALTADLTKAGVARAASRFDPPQIGWEFDYGWWSRQIGRVDLETR